MSLSVVWWEHEDALRVEDSLGDEVEAYFGEDVENLLKCRTFDGSFPVQCAMIKEFEHSDREILSWDCSTHILLLEEVLDLLALRRRIILAARKSLENRLELAIRDALRPTRLNILSSAFARDALQSEAWHLDEPIMIHYLNYILPRFDDDDRLDLDVYANDLDGFGAYLITSGLAQPGATTDGRH